MLLLCHHCYICHDQLINRYVVITTSLTYQVHVPNHLSLAMLLLYHLYRLSTSNSGTIHHQAQPTTYLPN